MTRPIIINVNKFMESRIGANDLQVEMNKLNPSRTFNTILGKALWCVLASQMTSYPL